MSSGDAILFLIDFFRPRERYGWLMVGVACIMLGMGMGSLFSISVFLKPVAAEFGWPRGDTAFAYSSAAILNGVSGIVMGALADRFSARPIVLFGSLVLGGSLILLGHIDSLWQFYLLYGPLIGALALATFLTPLLTSVSFWVEKHRGLAIGIVMGGQSLGGAVVPVVARHLISAVGWRETYVILGTAALLLLVPLALLVREPPGLAEAKAFSRRAGRQGGRGNLPIDPAVLLGVLCCAIVLCCICMSIPVVHLVSLATDNGIPPETAAVILGLMMAVSIIGRVGVGKVADLIGGVRALLLASAIQTVFIFWFTQMRSPAGFYLISVLFGIGYGGVIPSYAIIVREQLPVHSMGRWVGLVFFFGNLGMGSGGYLGGLLFDLSGSYTLPFAAGAAAGVLNLVVVGSLLFFLNSRTAALRTRAAEA
jgi:MFS family permease